MAAAERTALARFGGEWSWSLDKEKDGLKLNIGKVISGEGPGQGFAMLPWALDEYEKVLRLRPGESWLLKRMLAHAWTYGGEVFLSMRAISLRACVTRPTLTSYLRRLVDLGYIRRLSKGKGNDQRVRYDVSGLYGALALCIAADPRSKWSTEHGPLSVERVRGLTHSGPHGQNGNGNGHKKPKAVWFDLDFNALQELAKRRQGVEDDD
jgi:hypothetical protein